MIENIKGKLDGYKTFKNNKHLEQHDRSTKFEECI